MHGQPGTPLVMGVLNVTPDSFSDGGRWLDVDAAAARVHEMLEEGASIIDVGGESTRPGAAPVSVDEELARTMPVLEAIAPAVREAGARLSIDTRRPEVAAAALAAGATILNDVSASLDDVAAEYGAGWIAMHMQGDPSTMQAEPTYDDVVAEVLDFLTSAASRARAAGVGEVWVDPGIGFGKSFEHNWLLLAALDRFVDAGYPVVIGTSRKGFLGAELGRSDGLDDPVPVHDRLEGSMTTAVWAATMGVDMIRAHDIRATVQAVQVAGPPRPGAIVGFPPQPATGGR